MDPPAGRCFGSTASAAAVVLASFMAGMGAGAFYFGRMADRKSGGLALYGWLEIIGGIAAALVPILALAVDGIYGTAYRAELPGWLLTSLRVVLCGLVLFPASFALGGTLPALVRHATEQADRLGFEIGRLYAANTAGAVGGCFIAGFVLVPSLGVRTTVWTAAAATNDRGAASVRSAGCRRSRQGRRCRRV